MNMPAMPKVREFMTQSPKSISAATPLGQVQQMMKAMEVRHFPVEIDGKLAGIVTERSVRAGLLAFDQNGLTAQDVMIPDPYIVTPETELDLVVAAMADEKYGSVIVQDEAGRLVGIFTTVDACRVLRQFLQTHYPT